MISIPFKESERERLNKLIEFNILDTPEEEDYDDIVKLASFICGTPISLISLIDDKRQWFKAKVGLAARETPREWAFCAHAIDDKKVLVVNDATKDERFFDNPLVTDSPDIRFYAGFPLITSDNFALGTLCVIDIKPNALTDNQLFALETLAKQVIKNLELRINSKILANNYLLIQQQAAELTKTNKLNKKLISILSHDLRTPLSNLNNYLYLLENDMIDKSENDMILNDMQKGVESTIKLMENLLSWSLSQLEQENLSISKIYPYYIVDDKINIFATQLKSKNINIENNIDKDFIINSDQNIIDFLFRNLISNAIKFSNNNGIDINYKFEKNINKTDNEVDNETEFVIFEIKDYGVGMSDLVKGNIFNWDVKTSTIGTNREKGNGFGLIASKELVEKLSGELYFTSEVGVGTSFFIKIPLDYNQIRNNNNK